MTKSLKKSKLVKQFKKEKEEKILKEFNERVEAKVKENLNDDVNLVILKKQDPAVLLGETSMNGKTYKAYISYRYIDIVQHISQPKKDDELFDIPHYIVVFNENKLVVEEEAALVIEKLQKTLSEEDVVKRFTTLRDSVAVTGMFDGLGSMAGGL